MREVEIIKAEFKDEVDKKVDRDEAIKFTTYPSPDRTPEQLKIELERSQYHDRMINKIAGRRIRKAFREDTGLHVGERGQYPGPEHYISRIDVAHERALDDDQLREKEKKDQAA